MNHTLPPPEKNLMGNSDQMPGCGADPLEAIGFLEGS